MTGSVLVTGGCGFIGSHVVDRLLADGREVVVMDDLSTGRRENLADGAVFLEGSVAERAFVERAFAENRFAAVIHEASHINTSVSAEDPAHDVSVNVIGTINLVEAALANGTAKFIYASSVAVYGRSPALPVTEDGPIAPVYSYGIAKRCAEDYVRFHVDNHGLNAHIARYGNIYGPRQPIYGEVGVVAIFSNKVVNGEPLTVFGDGEHVRDFLFIDDAVEATVRLLGHPGADVFNVASGRGATVNEIFDLFQSAVGRPLTRREAPEREGELGRFTADTSKIERALGWKPRVTLAAGIERTLAAVGADA